MATSTRKTATPAARKPDEARREAPRETALQVPATRSAAPAVLSRGSMVLTDMDEAAVGSTEHAGQGLEKLRGEDVSIPRLKLIHGLSKELQEYDGLRAGDFFHDGSKAIMGQSFYGVVLYMDIRYILWRPRNVDGGGILARADDGIHWEPPNTEFRIKLSPKDGGHEVVWRTARTVAESGLHQFGTFNPNVQNSPPAATLQYNYLVAFPNDQELEPAIMTFQRSATKPGKVFNTDLRKAMKDSYGNTYALYQLAFEFQSVMATNGRGESFHNIKPIPRGRIGDTPENAHLLGGYKALFETYRDKGVKIRDAENMDDQGAPIEHTSREGAPAY